MLALPRASSAAVVFTPSTTRTIQNRIVYTRARAQTGCIPPKQRHRSAHITLCGCTAAAPASHQPERYAGDTVFDKHSCPAASKCGWPQSIHCEKVQKSGRTLPLCIHCEGASSAGRQAQLFMTCGGARCRAQWRRLKLDKRKCASAHEKNAKSKKFNCGCALKTVVVNFSQYPRAISTHVSLGYHCRGERTCSRPSLDACAKEARPLLGCHVDLANQQLVSYPLTPVIFSQQNGTI